MTKPQTGKALEALSDGELYLLNERIADEGRRRGWGDYWQEGGVEMIIAEPVENLTMTRCTMAFSIKEQPR